jgi:hypothetical protein
MGLPKRLTEMQREFARILVTSKGKITDGQAAIEAGYSKKRARITAAELKGGKKYPLVVDYINELRERNFEDNKLAINKVLEEFYHLLQAAREKLSEDHKKGNYRRVVVTVNKFKEVFNMLGYNNSTTIVYLAEEVRPYKTSHYKIGKTEVGLESRSTGRTDNPFGLNYISTFEYIPRNGFNLEKTFHNYFKNFSTYNEKYNTSASEWFSVKNRNTMIKNFRKIGSYYLYKNQLLHTYKYYGKEGYFK